MCSVSHVNKLCSPNIGLLHSNHLRRAKGKRYREQYMVQWYEEQCMVQWYREQYMVQWYREQYMVQWYREQYTDTDPDVVSRGTGLDPIRSRAL